MTNDLGRRDFLLRSCSSLTAVWVSAHWPALLSAASHARNAAQSPAAPKLEFFTADEAKEIDAITARIIPTDETPRRARSRRRLFHRSGLNDIRDRRSEKLS